MKKYVVLILLIIAYSKTAFSQANGFNIFIFPNQHSELYLKKYNYKYCLFLGQTYIDRDNTQQNNYEAIKKILIKTYPNATDTGNVAIDLENKSYADILSLVADKQSKERAVAQFTDLIEYIRKLRPKVKLGVYGMPARIVSNNDIPQKLNEDILDIISKCDFIAPSIYINKPAKATGIEKNDAFIDANLNLAFKYNRKVNKMVIPFVWSYIYSADKVYARKVIDVDEMVHYLKHIKDYKYGSQKASGVIWWEPSDPFYRTTGEMWKNANHMQIEHLRDSVLNQYMKKM